jgi:hypothetical protein
MPTSGAEEGSGLIAVMVLFAIIVVAGASFAHWVTSDLNNTGIVVNTSQARALAQAGLADALFRIDQQGWTPSSFCVGPSPCTVSSVPGAPGVQYTARYSNSVFTILSKGVSHGRTYVVKETVTRSPGIFTYAMFGVSSLDYEGDMNSIQATDPNGNPTGGPAPIGSAGFIKCSTGTAGTEQDIFGPGTGCANTVHPPGTYSPKQPLAACPAPPNIPPTPCMPPNPQPCPNGGVFDGSTSPFVLEPGVYQCTGSITFKGTVNIDYSSAANGGRVQIYLFPASGQTTTTIDMTGATINQWKSPPIVGDPTALQIYAAGGPGSVLNPGPPPNAASFNGLLYAPGMDSVSPKVNLTGGFVLNSWNNADADGQTWDLVFNLDTRVTTLGNALWVATLQDFMQIPPSQFSIP